MKNATLRTIIIAVLMLTSTVFAADPMWMWVSGSDSCDQSGISTMPGGRQQSMSWRDSSGNLWLFGGFGVVTNGTSQGLLNELWKFDGANWTRVKGTDSINRFGDYGTKGVSASGNLPGARYAGVSWTDSIDNLWLFGGTGYDSAAANGALNDLWRFNGTNWTWVNGPNTIGHIGVYGIKGEPNTNNTPGARSSSSTLTDSNDALWLFGGFGLGSSSSQGALNDLWKFSGSKWIWVSGSNIVKRKGVYGTKDVADANNMPGSRFGSAMWMDDQGNIWLYGGSGFDSKGTNGILSDVWKFDGTNWTWIYGPNLANKHPRGIYGTQGQSASNTVPGDRDSAFYWRDNFGFLWLFGGSGHDSAGTSGLLDDLWKFNGSVWEWVSGSNVADQNGIYGTKGVANSDNIPGARGSGCVWMDANNLWLFGGFGNDHLGRAGHLNDLWRFGNIVPTGVQLRIFNEANEIISQQSGTVVLGTAPQRAAGPSKTFTIRNNGSKTLVFVVPFDEPNHFTITQPEVNELAPGEDTTFAVTLDTAETGVFEEVISFDNNDVDNNPFEFTVKGTVVPWEFGVIPGQTKNIKFTANDVCGVPVTFSLTGGGYGVIEGDANFSRIDLFNTTARSQFTITTKAKTETSVGDITLNGSLKRISAKTTNLNGNITTPDACSITTIILNDVEDGHTISIGPSSNPRATVSMTFDEVSNLTINSGTPIKSISAVEWLGGAINASSMGNITIKGDRRRSIAGNFDVNVTLNGSAGSIKTAGTVSGNWACNKIKSFSALDINTVTLALDQEPNVKVLALGSLTAKRHIIDSNIISDGNVGTINAGSMINSLFYAGIKSGVSGLPNPATDINVFASIKSFVVKGIRGEPNSFTNSNVAAARILSATITNPQTENLGTPFGISSDFIKSVRIKFPSGNISLKNRDTPADNNDFGDFKIRLN